MPDDSQKEPDAEPAPEPVAEPVAGTTPAEPVQVEPQAEPEPIPEVVAEPLTETVEPQTEVSAEASAEAEKVIPPEAPPVETAQRENEPFPAEESLVAEGQPQAVPAPEAVAEPVPAPEPSPIIKQASPPPIPPFATFTTRAREMLVKARATIQSGKRKKLDKILTLLDTKKNIGNDDVEKLLRVSDATATRYLNQLEREGKIIQVGKTGQSVRYVRSG